MRAVLGAVGAVVRLGAAVVERLPTPDPTVRRLREEHGHQLRILKAQQRHARQMARIVRRPVPTQPASLAEAVDALWAAEGENNAGFVSAAGVLLLPPSVRAALPKPCLVFFAPDGAGGFCMQVRVDEEA